MLAGPGGFLVLGAGGDFLLPETQVLLYTVIVFLLLLALLWRFAWGPLMKALEEREQRIAQRIADGEAAQKQALERVAEYERKIARARDEAAEIIAEGKRDAVALRDEMLAGAEADAGRQIERARREIELAKEAAIHELREQMVRLTADLAARVIQREVRPEDHRRFIEDAMQQLERSAPRS
jgi:F-type H+-transporting ATPase subunit b